MKQFLILCIVSIFYLNSYSQISHGGQPYSFNNEGLKSNIDFKIMPEIDLEKLHSEDAMEDNDPDIPWRFGKDIVVDFNLNNSGTWEKLPNGDRIWRLEIISYDAYSLNLIYNKFHLPEGARLFLYNSQKTQTIGSFTNENHKSDGGFATIPVNGESCILEYYEPAAFFGEGEIGISYVIHAYKDFYAAFNKGFGGSGSCNVNVNCPEGDDWQEQKRGVAMVLNHNNSRICTGSMINNTAQDGTPYFLTANHCKGGENTWIIMFNYESPTCENIDGPTTQSVQYSTLKAYNTASDFCLVELSEVPPFDYNVFYNGWNLLDEAGENSTCIHHPKGDIKKISFDYDLRISDKYLGTQSYDDSHWKIEQWDLGTTEPGSSGSPLFNTSKHIIGQLHGGYASCTSPTADWYGKFSMSWNFGDQSDDQLKDWLDPIGDSPDSLDGFYPITNAYELNAMLLSVLSPNEYYGGSQSVEPVFVIRNMGNQIIEELNVSYDLGTGELFTKTWTGHIEVYDTAHVSFSSVFLDFGTYNLIAYIDSPNGNIDEYLLNDTIRREVFVNYDYDIAITNHISPVGVNCTKDTLNTIFVIKNQGVQSIQSMTVNVQIDDENPITHILNDPLISGTSKIITLDQIIPDEYWHHMHISVSINNIDDQNLGNNEMESDFTSFGNNLRLVINTDFAGGETSWVLKGENEEVIEEGSGYENNSTIKTGFCLPLGCYSFVIYDSGANGIQNDDGFSLSNSSTGNLLGSGTAFGDSLFIDFCITNTLSSDFGLQNDSTCKNKDVKFINLSTGADSYSWQFEGGTPTSSMEVSPVVQYKDVGVFDVSLRVWQGEETLVTDKIDFITVLNCSGIQEIENSMFKIFPNPSTGIFTIQMNNEVNWQSIRVINQLGEEIYQHYLENGLNKQFELNLENGMYIIEIKTEDSFARQMLLITK